MTKQKAILMALAGFTENFRQATTKELSVLWTTSLEDLSMEAILKGTRRCLNECEFFPTIAIFREKAQTSSVGRAGQWDVKPQQIEHASKSVKMPEDFVRNLIAKAKAGNYSHGVLNSLPVHGSEDGLAFRVTRDAHGRDYVYYFREGR